MICYLETDAQEHTLTFILKLHEVFQKGVRLSRIASFAKRPEKSHLCLLAWVGCKAGCSQAGCIHLPPPGLTQPPAKNNRRCRKAVTFCLFLAWLPWPAGSKDIQPCWASLGKAPSTAGTGSMEKGSVWTPGTPGSAEQTSRCWKSSVSCSASDGGGDEGGDPAVGNRSALQSWQEMRGTLCSAKSCSNFLRATGSWAKGGCAVNHGSKACTGEAQLGRALRTATEKAGSGRGLHCAGWIQTFPFVWGGIYRLPAGFLWRHKESSGTAPSSGWILLSCLPKQGWRVSGMGRAPRTHNELFWQGRLSPIWFEWQKLILLMHSLLWMLGRRSDDANQTASPKISRWLIMRQWCRFLTLLILPQANAKFSPKNLKS